jgi:hypothetical protein
MLLFLHFGIENAKIIAFDFYFIFPIFIKSIFHIILKNMKILNATFLAFWD